MTGGCEVVELRRYRLRPGRRETLIELFERELIEPQEAAGMWVIGQFRDGDEPDQFVWLRGFPDMDRRAAALATFYGGPVWARHKDAANATMINSDNVLLLRPASPGAGFGASAAPRAPAGAGGEGGGLIVATVCHLAPRTEGDFAAFFAAAVRPQLAAAGAEVRAAFIPERASNTFPRLPVREGETVFAWFSAFRDRPAYDAHLGALERSAAWRTDIAPELDRREWRRNEVSLLSPTSRSHLQY
ncbi:MAG: NIPSNAP family protein [Terriglobales bacterium]